MGLAAGFPVGIGAGFEGELKGSVAAKVGGVDVSTAGDEFADDFVSCAPGSVLQGGGVAGHFEVGIAFGPEGVGCDPEVEEGADAFEIADSSEAGEERASYL